MLNLFIVIQSSVTKGDGSENLLALRIYEQDLRKKNSAIYSQKKIKSHSTPNFGGDIGKGGDVARGRGWLVGKGKYLFFLTSTSTSIY